LRHDISNRGKGIVGTRLIFDLLQDGNHVRATKRASSDLEFSKRVFQFYSKKDGESLFKKIEWVNIDLEDIYSIREHMVGITRVYHTAGLVSYRKADEAKLLATNYVGTQNLVNICLEFEIEKLCHVSSVAALGAHRSQMPADEDSTWKKSKSNSNYAFSKYLAEREVWRGTAEGLAAVIVNPSIILAPSKPHQSSGAMMDMLMKGISFYPPGTTGLVDVADVSKASIKLMTSDIENRRFVLNAENLSYKELLETAADIFDNNKPRYEAKYWMLKLYQWIEGARSLITGKPSEVTAETVRNAFTQKKFSNSRAVKELEINFTSVRETLLKYRAFYL